MVESGRSPPKNPRKMAEKWANFGVLNGRLPLNFRLWLHCRQCPTLVPQVGGGQNFRARSRMARVPSGDFDRGRFWKMNDQFNTEQINERLPKNRLFGEAFIFGLQVTFGGEK